MIVFEDLLRRTVGDQIALAHNIRAFTNGQRFTDVMVGDQDAKPAVAQVFNDSFDVDNRDRVNAGKRFIQKDKFRICGQRTRNLNTTAFPAGEIRPNN